MFLNNYVWWRYAIYHGPAGLQSIAHRIHHSTVVLAKGKKRHHSSRIPEEYHSTSIHFHWMTKIANELNRWSRRKKKAYKREKKKLEKKESSLKIQLKIKFNLLLRFIWRWPRYEQQPLFRYAESHSINQRRRHQNARRSQRNQPALLPWRRCTIVSFLSLSFLGVKCCAGMVTTNCNCCYCRWACPLMKRFAKKILTICSKSSKWTLPQSK